jgi:hypothetical protein
MAQRFQTILTDRNLMDALRKSLSTVGKWARMVQAVPPSLYFSWARFLTTPFAGLLAGCGRHRHAATQCPL